MKFLPVMRNVLCALLAAAGAALFLLASSEALGQSARSTRAPHILQHNGKRFTAYVDEKSETATWIIDTDSLDFNLGGAPSLSSKSSVSAAADAFLDAHAGVFGVDTKQLSEPRVETDGAFWFISYVQVYEGLRVLGSQVGITVTYSGRIVAAGARAFPKLDVQAGASISKGAAIAFARGQTTIPRTEATVKEDLVVVPEELAERYVFRLAWVVVLEDRDHDPPFSKTFLVDAHTGDVIAEYSNILDSFSQGQRRVRFAVDESSRPLSAHAASISSTTAAIPYALPRTDIPEESIFKAAPPKTVRRETVPSGTGSLYGEVTLNYYESPDSTHHPFTRRENQPFPYAKVTVQNDATQETRVVYADENGDYSVPNLADTTHTVTFEIANDKAYITDEEYAVYEEFRLARFPMCLKEKSFSIEINGRTQFDFNWGWGDSGDGGLTSYALNGVYHMREMYEYFRNEDTYNYDGVDTHKYLLQISEARNHAHYAGTASGRPANEKSVFLGLVNAMSNEIVFHEFMHDVWNTLYRSFHDSLITLAWGMEPEMPSIYLDVVRHKEFGAMDEGFADYFAADKTNDFTFAGPSGRDSTGMDRNNDPLEIVRELGTSGVQFLWNNCTMDDIDIKSTGCGGTKHLRGRIIAGAIWKIREEKDKQISSQASQLLFIALQIKPQPATFEQLRDRYATADKHSNNGTYAATIEDRFAERRIGGPAIPGGPSIAVDSATDYNPEVTWIDNSLIEEGYLVERQYNDNDWVEVAKLDANTDAYIDTSYQCIAGGSDTGTYSYRIVPYKDYTDGIGIVRTESAAVTLSLNSCTETVPMRIAQASPAAEMTDDAQLEEHKVPTGLEVPYPNPFNPVTTIHYGLAEEGPVRLTVYDLLGRRVAVLLDGVQIPGKHTVRFEASSFSSGLYFVILHAGGKTFTKSVLLMK